jgi:hypothetical protein
VLIEAIENDTNVKATSETDAEGLYYFASLHPGAYRLVISKQGFKQIIQAGVVLHVQDRLTLNFGLQIGSVNETVNVTAETTNVNTTDASASTVVDRQFVENMPLNGRSFQSLIELTPGVVNAKTYYYGSQGQFSVNGQRSDSNYFTVDGVSANVAASQGAAVGGAPSAGALPAVTAGGGFNNLVSVDAMQEFKIQTSTFAPEFGRTPGAQVSIATRSGTNQFHGTAFEYLRNDKFDAADWFTDYYGLPKPPEKQNDFGGVVGGPILKNRLFFFFSYEGLRLRQPQTKTEVDPSTTARTAAPAAIQPLLNAFPVPNVSNGPLTGVFAASYSNPSTLNATSIRVDYAATKKINVFGRYDHAPSNAAARGAFDYYSLSTVGHTIANLDTVTAGVNVALKSNLLDEFHFNYSRSTGATAITAGNFGGAVVPPDSYLFAGNPQASSKIDAFTDGLYPDVNGWGIGTGGDLAIQHQLNFVDTLTWTRGPHAIKMGFDYRRLTPIDGYYPYTLYAGFNGMAGALANDVSFLEASSVDSSYLRPLFQNLSFFAQDTWQVKPNLTLTYGLRWDYNPPVKDTSGHGIYTAANLNDPPNIALAPKGTPLYSATHDNFAPRLGLAYRMRSAEGRELVLRGGFGIFYDLGNNSANSAGGPFPYWRYNYSYDVPWPPTSDEAGPVPFTLNPPYEINTSQPNLKLPRTYQWNFSLQQSLGSNQSVTATYIGAAGRRLLRDEAIMPSMGLNENFEWIRVTTNDGYSNYNSLQLQYQRHLSRGLQVLASYTWAHALDNASVLGLVAPYYTVYNPNLDYGNGDSDVRHSVQGAVTYNIPTPGHSELLRTVAGNWALDSLFRGNTAVPVNILTGADPFGLTSLSYNNTVGRPDVVPGVPLYLYGSHSQYPGGKAINPAAFSTPTQPMTQGDLGRNALRGFGAWEEDFTIRREFPIHEQVKLQFRAEFFNIFNHPNFGDPGTQGDLTNVLGNPSFGLSTATLAQSLYSGGGSGTFNPLYQMGGPRSVQLALKLLF